MDNELYHYGVLGMKWGVHRARKKGNTYTYKSYTTKKYEKKANKAKDSVKSAKFKQRAKRSAELDRKEQNVALRMSTAKVLATRAFTLGIGSKPYLRYRALGDSKVKALLKTSVLWSTPFYMIDKAKYIRQDE